MRELVEAKMTAAREALQKHKESDFYDEQLIHALAADVEYLGGLLLDEVLTKKERIDRDSIQEKIAEAKEYVNLSETHDGRMLAGDFGKILLSDKSQHQLRVEAFMNGISAERQKVGIALDEGQTVGEKPRMIGLAGRKLRAALILEEALETIEGLGFGVNSELQLENIYAPDLVAAVDGCLDLLVVTTGTLSALGVPDEAGLRIVDENNLAKLAPGREDGKLLKPLNHAPPNLSAWLDSF